MALRTLGWLTELISFEKLSSSVDCVVEGSKVVVFDSAWPSVICLLSADVSMGTSG